MDAVTDTQPVREPAFSIPGDATPEEVAAIVALLMSASGEDEPADAAPSLWADHQRGVRLSPTHGHGAWRASTQPR
jgi:hypothetical protein